MPTVLSRARVRSGNIVSDFGNTTKRKFKPNVVVSEFYSELLEKSIPMRVTTRVQRTVHKKGGLDNFMLLSKEKDHVCEHALALRKQIEEKFLEKGIANLAVGEDIKRQNSGLEGAHCLEERVAALAEDTLDDLVPTIAVKVRQSRSTPQLAVA
jgi:large subunit ribosomal protein L28